MNRSKLFLIALVAGFIVASSGCSQSGPSYSSVTVEPKSHTFEVQAKGEITATEEVSISVPSNVNMSFQILWLVPEYSEVKKGDVIARFDDAAVITEIERRELEIEQHELEFANTGRNNEETVTQIIHETVRVDGETDIAKRYEDLEVGVFSMHEIIDAIDNLEYLSVQKQFYMWEKDSNQRRFDAETQKIQADMQMSQEGLDRNVQALEIMELKSPEDGTFVYASMGWGGGQKIAPGQTIWRGRRIGSLPIRGKVRADIHVLEVDAVGIEEGQRVEFRIDSAMEHSFTGTITEVPRMARSLDGFDPTKYRIVHAEFDEVNPDLMRVGSSISATITTDVLEEAILVPQQAVFFDEDRPHVYVFASSPEPEIRYVELGRKSPTLIEISSGLEPGERISLVAPTRAAT